MSDGRMLYWEQLAWLNGAKSENSEMVLQYIKNYFHLKKEMDALDITMEDGKIIEKIYLY